MSSILEVNEIPARRAIVIANQMRMADQIFRDGFFSVIGMDSNSSILKNFQQIFPD